MNSHITATKRIWDKSSLLTSTSVYQVITALLLAISFGLPWCAHAADRKPNVLFIAVDDLRPELGCYGAKGMLTPNIDRLAASGVLFERHYVQFAVCIPSRAALLTSLRSERTHQIYGPPMWDKVPGVSPIGKTFKAGGYSTVSLGKIWHVEGGQLTDVFDVKWAPDGGQYANPGNAALSEKYRKAKVALKKSGQGDAEPGGPLPPVTECAEVPDNAYADGMIADRAIAEMSRLQGEGNPFLLAVGFHKPHIPFVAPRKYWELFDESKLSLAPNPEFPRDMPSIAFSGNPNFYNYDYEAFAPLPQEGRMPDATARHIIHGYRAAVSFVDAQVGRVLDELDRLGLTGNTIVVLWGDHGFHLGDTGMWGKQTNFESATRSPLIARAPGRTKAGSRSRALVETVDIFPTLLDLCGLPPLPLSDGRSFLPLLDDPQRPWKEAVCHVFDRHPKVDGKSQLVIGHGVRSASHRLVSWRAGWELSGKEVAVELYDYDNDPFETRNVAADPSYAQTLAKLRQLLQELPANQPSPAAKAQ